MSKNLNKGRRPNLPPAAFMSPAAAAVAAGSPSIGATSVAARQSATAVRVIDWQGEYGDVMSDLKRTGLIAMGLIAVLIALSFVL